MAYISRSSPCPGFPVAINFTDVEPEVLADEEARERHRQGLPPAPAWHAYLRRVLPALERGSAVEMAQALLAAGTAEDAAITHSETMRRRALAAGEVRRARFWDDVTSSIRRG
jgi:hypothetical protein